MHVSIINGKRSETFKKFEDYIKKIQESGTELVYDKNIQHCYSEIDTTDKFSKDYNDCTGIVLFGKDKITQKTISCITHTDILAMPSYKTLMENEKRISNIDSKIQKLTKDLEETGENDEIIDDIDGEWMINKKEYLEKEILNYTELRSNFERNYRAIYEDFEKDTNQILSKFSEIIKPDSASGIIIGGQVITKDLDPDINIESRALFFPERPSDQTDRYNLSIDLWKSIVSQYLGFEPKVAHSPRNTLDNRAFLSEDGTDVYVKTDERKVYIVFQSMQLE